MFVGKKQPSKDGVGVKFKTKQSRNKVRKRRRVPGPDIQSMKQRGQLEEFLSTRYQELYDMYSTTLQKTKVLEKELAEQISEETREKRLHDLRLSMVEVQLKEKAGEKKIASLSEDLEESNARLKHEVREKELLQIQLENVTRRASENKRVTDLGHHTLEDLARLFAKLFNIENYQVQNRSVVNGRVVTSGVSQWFKFIVNDGFYYVNTKLQGTLGSLEQFVRLTFENDIADSFCEFLRDFQKYKECRFEKMTGKDRKAIEIHRKQSCVKFIAKLTECVQTNRL